MSIESLKIAIQSRTPIQFEYNKEGKTPGRRLGNPHAVFVMHRKDGSESTKVHIVQTGGVTDSGQEFPSFRMFDLSDLTSVALLEDGAPFSIDDNYNSGWDGYQFAIVKI